MNTISLHAYDATDNDEIVREHYKLVDYDAANIKNMDTARYGFSDRVIDCTVYVATHLCTQLRILGLWDPPSLNLELYAPTDRADRALHTCWVSRKDGTYMGAFHMWDSLDTEKEMFLFSMFSKRISISASPQSAIKETLCQYANKVPNVLYIDYVLSRADMGVTPSGEKALAL